MSNLNAFFKRKSKTTITDSRAIQAPQPVYNSFTKNLSNVKKKETSSLKKNSILNYLTKPKLVAPILENSSADTINIQISETEQTAEISNKIKKSHSNAKENEQNPQFEEKNQISEVDNIKIKKQELALTELEDEPPIQCTLRYRLPYKKIWDQIMEEYNSDDDDDDDDDNYYAPIEETKKDSSTKSSNLDKEKKQDYVLNDKLHDKTRIACQIKHTLPFSPLWKQIVDEFDFEDESDSANDDDIKVHVNYKSELPRKRKFRDEQNEAKNVRFRSTYKVLEAHTKENLTRPLRIKHTVKETNAFLMNIADELFSYSDNSWFQLK